jgi:ABC-2 type transport system ATP-binding protein
MDEPTIGLDPHQILIVRDLIARLRGRMTVIISSHILPEIEMTCDRVLIINRGQVVAQGSPAALRREFLGRSAYELEVAGDFEALPALLAHIEPSLRLDPPVALEPGSSGTFHRLRVVTDREDDLGEVILRGMVTAPGLRVRGLRRAEPSLEDVFLAATQRSWDVVDGATRPDVR